MLKLIGVQPLSGNTAADARMARGGVELTFENEFGCHSIELPTRNKVIGDAALHNELKFMLWDFGLFHRKDARCVKERLQHAQALLDAGPNHSKAIEYLAGLGRPKRVELYIAEYDGYDDAQIFVSCLAEWKAHPLYVKQFAGLIGDGRMTAENAHEVMCLHIAREAHQAGKGSTSLQDAVRIFMEKREWIEYMHNVYD